MSMFWKPLTDEEYVECLRHSLRKNNRFGVWISLAALSALLFLLWQFGQVLLQFLHGEIPFPLRQVPNPTAWIACGFIFGALIGVGFGGILQAHRDGVLLPFTGMRTERLLVRYHDQLQGVVSCETEADPLDGLFFDPGTGCEPVDPGGCPTERNELRRHLRETAGRSTLSAKS